MANVENSKPELLSAVSPSTSKRQSLRSGASWISSAPPATQSEFLDSLEEGELRALPYLFEFWAFEHQLPPEGNWRTWVILGGRGAGKTRAGAEWVRSQVEGSMPFDPGRSKRMALVGETYDQVRDVMIFGDSGILACSPEDRRPQWEASRRRLVWPNGAIATTYSANDPEALRGPQFDAAWVDELAKWPNAQNTWDMLQFALRLGDDPRVCVTTTPRNVDIMKDLLASPSTVSTHARTEVNRANLADSFLQEVRARYAGTRMAQQELDGLMLEDAEGALWTSEMLENSRADKVPELDRIVVAVDPAVTSGPGADECGIVVAGLSAKGPPQTWRAYVLADCSVTAAGPSDWARAAVRAWEDFGADRMVAEVNQGGQLVTDVVQGIAPHIRVHGVHATKGKVARAEPVAAFYEQGRVRHVDVFDRLESQMVQMTSHGYEGTGSPDRVDALVWALHDLMIETPRSFRNPSVRHL